MIGWVLLVSREASESRESREVVDTMANAKYRHRHNSDRTKRDRERLPFGRGCRPRTDQHDAERDDGGEFLLDRLRYPSNPNYQSSSKSLCH